MDVKVVAECLKESFQLLPPKYETESTSSLPEATQSFGVLMPKRVLWLSLTGQNWQHFAPRSTTALQLSIHNNTDLGTPNSAKSGHHQATDPSKPQRPVNAHSPPTDPAIRQPH